MKKFGKFIFGALAGASAVAGVYYLYKTYIKKDSSDDFEDFEDFEDDFEDFEDEEASEEDTKPEAREYVSINMPSEPVSENETNESVVTEEAETPEQ